jgi:hypothetical protein
LERKEYKGLLLTKKDYIEKKSLSKIVNEPWARKMLEPFWGNDISKNKVLRYTDFKKRLKKNDKQVSEHLAELTNANLLKKLPNDKGYVLSPELSRKYLYKYRDMKLIEDSSLDFIKPYYLPYSKKPKEKLTRSITIYGLEKKDKQIDEILVSFFPKIRAHIDSFYNKIFSDIIEEECSKISDKKLKQYVYDWRDMMLQNMLLLPSRNKGDEVIPLVQFDSFTDNNYTGEIDLKYFKTTKEYEDVFKKICQKIWDNFNEKCPPIGILMRF